MSREWKPGDVLTGHINSPFRGREVFFVVEVTANSRTAWGPGLHAVNADGNGTAVANIIDARPLVVIDPDSPKDQRRLLSLLRNSGAFRGVVAEGIALDCIGDALREFANPTPPKPDEPTGLGAVVEDSEGALYVRHAMPFGEGETTWCDPDGIGRPWSRVAAVRVLSGGVTA